MLLIVLHKYTHKPCGANTHEYLHCVWNQYDLWVFLKVFVSVLSFRKGSDFVTQIFFFSNDTSLLSSAIKKQKEWKNQFPTTLYFYSLNGLIFLFGQ